MSIQHVRIKSSRKQSLLAAVSYNMERCNSLLSLRWRVVSKDRETWTIETVSGSDQIRIAKDALEPD